MKLLVAILFSFLAGGSCLGAITITPRNGAQQWRVAEFSIAGVPAVANPFDPDLITVRGDFVGPSGKTTSVEGFWYQDYRAALSGSTEVLTAQGAAEWRLRFTPDEAGDYQLTVTVTTAGGLVTGSASFNAASGGAANVFKAVPNVRVPQNSRYFEIAGEPVILNGENVCWHGSRGTFDYLDWFSRMHQSGENYARLWMCPWAFGIETEANSRTNYSLKKAWQLDQAMRIGETNGILVMLCLEYHGMFQTVVDQFGGNNAWVQNPYNLANGGPCATPNAFFTSAAAQDVYKKRLRYIVARWGASPNLLCWEFFNEIDNSYNNLNATDVANWHATMGAWLKAADPYKRLITTSLTGSSDRPEIWNVRALDFAQYHSYGAAAPATQLPTIVQRMMNAYHKPVLLSEYGIDSSGFHVEKDPYFRGLRQGVWSALMAQTPGTAMSWWWEEIHARNLYPIYNSVSQFLRKTAIAKGSGGPLTFVTNGDPPATVGNAIADAAPFTATLNLSGQWGFITPGALAVADPDAAARAPSVLDAFFHGTSHADLLSPFRLSAWFAANAKMVMHLNSVSDGAQIKVLVDGVSVFLQAVPNKDGKYDVNNEYNVDYTVPIAAGKHSVQIVNAGADWFYLDWVRLENVQPATYANGWTASPIASGLSSGSEAAVYVVNPAANFPVNATNAVIAPMTNGVIKLTSWALGSSTAYWYDAKTMAPLGTTSATATNVNLQLALPSFSEDIVGRIVGQNHVSGSFDLPGETLAVRLDSPAASNSRLESTADFLSWRSEAPAPFGTNQVVVPINPGEPVRLFRLNTGD
jgi:hypothetical protein